MNPPCFAEGTAWPRPLAPVRLELPPPSPGLPIVLYGLLCGYGRSYMRPIYGVVVTIIAVDPAGRLS
jgi:hypothetical protein